MHIRSLPALLVLIPAFAAGAGTSLTRDIPPPATGCHPRTGSSGAAASAAAAAACNALGILDLRAGDSKAGEAKFREAIALATEALGESNPDVALYEANLALALGVQGQVGRAEVLLNRARYIVDTTLPSGDARLATVLTEISAVETAQRHFARAEADAKQSLAIVLRHHAPDTVEVAVQQVVLATVWIREKKIPEVEALLPGAVAVERRLAADPSFDQRALAQAVRTLAELRVLERRWTEARNLYRETIGIYEATSGASHPAIAPILLEYAQVLRHCGAQTEQVRSVEARAKALRTMRG